MKEMIELRNMSARWVAWLAGPAARSGPIAGRRESACPMEAVSTNFLTAAELWWMIEANPCRIMEQIGIKNKKLEIISNELDRNKSEIRINST